MSMTITRPAPPSSDRRWKLVEATMRRHGYSSHALIETLHTVQETFGYLEEEALRYVSGCLHVPLSKVFGVATFYSAFTLKPKGEHTCVVCMGTACYIKGAPQLLGAIEQEYGIRPEETTADNQISLLTARCVGSCGLAPAVVFDGDVVGKLDRNNTMDRLRKWTSHDTRRAD